MIVSQYRYLLNVATIYSSCLSPTECHPSSALTQCWLVPILHAPSLVPAFSKETLLIPSRDCRHQAISPPGHRPSEDKDSVQLTFGSQLT